MNDYELYHADRKKHKYIKKIGNRYFYTQQEIAAYLGEKKTSLGVKELDTVINRDQEAFYAKNSQDSNRALRQKREAQKKYDKTVLGKVDKATNGLATAPYRTIRNKSRSRAEQKARETREANAEARRVATENVNAAQEKGKAQTSKVKAQMAIRDAQNRGKVRTAQLSGKPSGSKEYNEELAYNSKQNNFPKSSSTTKDSTRRRKKATSVVSKASKKSVKSLSKSSSKGKRALKKFYKNNVNPGVTVTYDEAKIK